MSDQTNPSDFSVANPNEYEAVLRIEGTMRVIITAESLDDARSKAGDMMDTLTNNIDDIEFDDVDDVALHGLCKARRMYRVTRGGQPMQVSRLEPGDMPREADQRGF